MLCFVFRLIIFWLLGPWAVVANLIGALIPFTGALLVNSVGHMPSFGYQTFNTGEKSTNVWWVAMLSLGEGWHNNHHAIPQSARHGMKPLEFDLSWESLKLLKRVGLASEFRLPSSAVVEKKQKLDSISK